MALLVWVTAIVLVAPPWLMPKMLLLPFWVRVAVLLLAAVTVCVHLDRRLA